VYLAKIEKSIVGKIALVMVIVMALGLPFHLLCNLANPIVLMIKKGFTKFFITFSFAFYYPKEQNFLLEKRLAL